MAVDRIVLPSYPTRSHPVQFRSSTHPETSTAVKTLLVLESEAIVERLSSQLDERAALLAFDADGTLWSGDVSDDVFLTACREAWLLEAALPALRELAESLGLDASGSASRLGMTLFDAQKVGTVAEATLYEAMTWCYAGHTLEELTAYTAKVLLGEGIVDRIRPEIRSILDWAARANVQSYVVSASPKPIVQWAAALWGFTPNRIIGTEPAIVDGVIAPAIVGGVPFGANKCKLLKRISRNLRWLACFGDSEFDFEMLECADLAVAVSPKPNLVARLLPLGQSVQLKTSNIHPSPLP